MATRGKVKWFSESKGYGLVEKEDGGEIFAHFSEIASESRKTLSERDEVSFDSMSAPKGANAVHVVKLVMAPSRILQPL